LQIGILEPLDFSKEALSLLNDIGSVKLYTGSSLESFCLDLDVLFIRLASHIDSDFLDLCPQLKYLCSPTTGLTHIDLTSLMQRRIQLICLKDEVEFLKTITPTAEHALGLLLALIRNYKTAFKLVDSMCWDRDMCRGLEIQAMNIGIIGFGRIGSILSEYLLAMRANISVYDPFISQLPPQIQRRKSILSLITNSTSIFLCASYTPSSPHLLTNSHLLKLKNKFLVNISRGELIDETSMFHLARVGHFAGLGLDVLTSENTSSSNLEAWSNLSKSNCNIILTPHIGGASFSSMAKTEVFIANKLLFSIQSDV